MLKNNFPKEQIEMQTYADLIQCKNIMKIMKM